MKMQELRDIIRNATSNSTIETENWDPYSDVSSFYGTGAVAAIRDLDQAATAYVSCVTLRVSLV